MKENIIIMKIKYIYNYVQADYFIKNGAVCIGTGYNAKSQHFYWEFDRDKIQYLYPDWEKNRNVLIEARK